MKFIIVHKGVKIRREITMRLYNGIKDGCHWGFFFNTLMLCKLILSISKYLSDDCLINEFRSWDIQIVCVNMQLESTCNLTLSICVYWHATCVDMQHIKIKAAMHICHNYIWYITRTLYCTHVLIVCGIST